MLFPNYFLCLTTKNNKLCGHSDCSNLYLELCQQQYDELCPKDISKVRKYYRFLLFILWMIIFGLIFTVNKQKKQILGLTTQI